MWLRKECCYSPLLVGAWSPEDHDHTEDDGKQDVPETVVKPHLPPVLWRRERDAVTVLALLSESSIYNVSM